MKKIIFEACVDSFQSALAAQNGGADRIELCADLLEGGITPSAGLIELVREKLNIPVMVMIRPRGGDFLYSENEFEEMMRDVFAVKKFNPAGVVFGILNENGAVDKARSKILIESARPLSITFHRAFDMTQDPFAALEDLIELGIDRVLTSGQELDVERGIISLKQLVDKAGEKIIIMPGGGVNEFNAAKILKETRAKEIHASAREKKESGMKFRNPKTTMSDSKNMAEYELMVTSEKRVRLIRKSVDSI